MSSEITRDGMARKLGETQGRAWAAEASAEERERLEAFYTQNRDGLNSFADVLAMEKMAPWSNADSIAAAIMGFDEDGQLHAEAVEYAEQLFGDHADDDDYLDGFVCGALNVAS